MNTNKSPHRVPWEAAGHLIGSPEDRMDRGAIDAIGEENYNKPRNVEDKCAVVSLQNLLRGLGADIDADGAFGRGTQNALQEFTGYPDYVMGRDLPTLLEKLSARIATNLRSDTSTPGTEGLSVEAKLIQEAKNHIPFTTDPIPPHYCQGDPTYCKMPDGKDRILGEKYTFRGSGCAVTCVSMIGSWLMEKLTARPAIDPAQMDDFLDNHMGYQGDGIKWQVAAQWFSELCERPLSYDRIEGLSPEDYILRAKNMIIDHEWPIIMAVRYVEQKKPRDIDHFVCVYGTMIDDQGKLQLRFLDPGRGVGGQLDNLDNTTLTTHKGGFIPKRLDFFLPS